MTNFTRILCVVDPGRARERTLERAVQLAEAHEAELSVIDVIAPRPSGWRALEAQWPAGSIETARRQRLAEMVAPFSGRRPIRPITVTGIPFLCIIGEVLRGGHDLVIREGENPDWLDRLLGSDDMQLLRQCPCPVWVLDPAAPKRWRRVLAAVDVDQEYPSEELETRHALNRRILDLAYSVAIAESATLHVVTAWRSVSSSRSYPGMPPDLVHDYIRRTGEERELALATLLGETVDALGEDVAGRVERHEHAVSGSARREIPALARTLGVDLLVMGSVARTGVPGFIIGNTAESILCQLDRSVLVAKPPGFVTPVTIER